MKLCLANKSIQEIRDPPNTEDEESDFNFENIMGEFKEKEDELLEQEKEDGSCEGSDSEPSEDNMSDEEIAKILPSKPKKKRIKKLVTQASIKKRNKELEKKLKEKNKRREEAERAK
jgi:hypothetical protein